MKHPLFAVAALSVATLLAASAAPTPAARPKDVAHILRSDLFIHVGGESDGWAEPLVERKRKAGQGVLDFMETLRDAVKAEEVVEGMQAEDDHDHDHGHAHGRDEDDHDHDDHDHGPEEVENDEHVWLSLRFAVRLVDAMAVQIAALDPAHAADYRANAAAYAARLRELDARYAQTVAKAARKTVLFADRFPFRYLVEDYGLKHYAAFVGCSAESEASFKTVAFLAAKVDELCLPCVLMRRLPRSFTGLPFVRGTTRRPSPGSPAWRLAVSMMNCIGTAIFPNLAMQFRQTYGSTATEYRRTSRAKSLSCVQTDSRSASPK